ncbi:hypothetical protein KKG56_11830 [bacterium]|nr:hypothetical protein [bacterium]
MPTMQYQPFVILDVLGFSKIMKTQPLLKVYDHYMALIITVLSSRGFKTPQFVLFSDTVCIFPSSANDTETSIRDVVHYTSVLIGTSIKIQEATFSVGEKFVIPLRGAVSFGEFLADPAREVLPNLKLPVILGRPVVEAHEWEKSQKWIGASLVPGTEELIKKKNPKLLDELLSEHYLIPWDVPTTHGLVSTLALNYVGNNKSVADILHQALCKAEEEAKEAEDISEAEKLSIEAKYKAARLFVEHISQRELYAPLHPYAPSLDKQ